jgi:hypothetical protein
MLEATFNFPFTIDKRYFDNDAKAPMLRLTVPSIQETLAQSLTIIVRGCPPVLPWAGMFRGQTYRGLLLGPTSIAYLFLWVSKTQPDLIIDGKAPGDWCNALADT